MIGKPDKGCKPVVRDSKPSTDDCPPTVHGMPKAAEKSTKPVTNGGTRATTGWVRGEDNAKDPTIP